MTIKDFARLCDCNPQTLRYYDRVGLLKPARIDAYSGYRYYDKEQALDFVKIRNLQSAGFSIAEIKELLNRENDEVLRAFDRKIMEQEEKLSKMKMVRLSYLSEIKQMKEKLEEIRKQIRRSMDEYDASEEFGIEKDEYTKIAENIDTYFEEALNWIEENGLDGKYELTKNSDIDPLNDLSYETIYEKHGWNNVRDFYDEFFDLKDKEEYVLVFRLNKDKDTHMAFANTMLNMLLKDNEGKERKLGCSVNSSDDGENHFWLLRKKA